MSKVKFEIVTHGPDETIELGRRIGANLVGGEVILLVGNLGTGKTHLIKGITAGLGADDADEVNSPTFVLINEYEGPNMRLDAYHIDGYRLDSVAEFEMLGFDDICYPRSVVMIEWADKVDSALTEIDAINIELTHQSISERGIIIKNITQQLCDAIS